jgi:hypothetical protein
MTSVDLMQHSLSGGEVDGSPGPAHAVVDLDQTIDERTEASGCSALSARSRSRRRRM